jgi:hypothetical protein
MEGIYQPKFDTERKGESLKFPNSRGSNVQKPPSNKNTEKVETVAERMRRLAGNNK